MKPSIPLMNWTPGHRQSSSLQVHLLGMTDLDAALTLQNQVADEIAQRCDTFGVLLLCEHPTTVTIGREGSAADLLEDRLELESRGIPVRWLRRGGGTWAHHPGQLMAYSVIPATRLGFDNVGYQQRLVSALNAVGQDQRVLADEPRELPGSVARCGQWAFVGSAVTQGITRFGVCVNVSVPRGALAMVDWGITGRPSSLAAERMRPLGMASVRESWIRHFAAQMGYDRYQIWTGHPLLRRTTRRVYVCAET